MCGDNVGPMLSQLDATFKNISKMSWEYIFAKRHCMKNQTMIFNQHTFKCEEKGTSTYTLDDMM